MATITISDVDDALVEKITRLAKQHNHSIEKEIRDLLHEALGQRHEVFMKKISEDSVALLGAERRSLIDIVNAIAALTPKGVPQTDSVTLLREDRER